MIEWDSKDPDEIEDFSIDYTERLAEADSITSSTWIIPDGLTMVSSVFDDTKNIATVILTDGVDGQRYYLTNQIITSLGRKLEETGSLLVQTSTRR